MDETELRALLLAVQRGSLAIDVAVSRLHAPAGPSATQAPAPAERGEFERIAELTRLFSQTSAAVQLGIGDDAALLRASEFARVLSVDVAVQGVHFDQRFASWQQIGARAFNAALSDLAAMGATPTAALCSLIIPPALPNSDFSQLNAGIAQAALDHACPVIGGNLSSGRELSVTTTVIGELRGRGLYRHAAKAGDAIYVTGPLGSAALGLVLLQQAQEQRGPEFVQAFRAPRARIAQGLAIAQHAHAAVDVSDGALQDLGHICAASGLGAELEAKRVPFAPGFEALARALGRDPLSLALLGGEDYELIYTQAADAPAGPGTYIGRMRDAPGPARVVDERGLPLSLQGRAYQHF